MKSIVYSQSPEWQWARSGFGQGAGLCAAVDEFDNGYISGMYFSPLSFDNFHLTNNIVNGFQAYVAKFDSSGSALWAKSARGNLASGNKICTDKYANVYLAGIYFGDSISFDQLTLRNTVVGEPNYFIVKYDSSGTALWVKGMVSGLQPNPSALVCDRNNNLYFSGEFSSSSILFDGDTLNNLGSRNSFVTKFDQSGNVIWSRRIGGSSSDCTTGMMADEIGNIYVSGYFKSPILHFGADSLTNSGGMDSFLVKYDSNGNFIWAKSSEGNRNENPRGVSGNSEGIYITGTSNSSQISFGSVELNDTTVGTSRTAMFLCKYDSSGNVVWARNLPGYNCIPYSTVVRSDNDILISGHLDTALTMFDTIAIPATQSSFDPMFITQIGASGNVEWVKTLSSGGDYISSLAVYKNSDIFIAGDFSVDPFIVGNDTLNFLSWECPFVAKLNVPTQKTTNENSCNSFVYPNPFTTELNVSGVEGMSEFYLYDILARQFYTTTFNSEIRISLSDIPKGVYIYEILCSEGRVERGKIIKQD